MIRLDNGHYTCPEIGFTIEEHPWFRSAAGLLSVVFPGDKTKIRVADLGCLEGGYTVEFARLGFQATGIEVRHNNFQACQYVKANTNLINLEYIRDDAWNVARYGPFDAVFCCGLSLSSRSPEGLSSAPLEHHAAPVDCPDALCD